MNTIVFSGQSPSDISGWLDSHSSAESPFSFQKLANKLENFPQLSGFLPRIGSSLDVKYKVDPNGEAVDTEWMVLGYNKDIPRFVKYKDSDGNKVYMDVLPDTSNTLLTSFNGANVYSKKDGSGGVIGTVEFNSFVDGQECIYGNNNPYQVPTSITINNKTYTFCGYNVTLQSKYGLAAKYVGNLYTRAQFRSYEKSNEYRNDWRTSEIRTWLNGTDAVSTQRWKRSSDENYTTGTIVVLFDRLSDDFTNNIIPTVTRTWVYSSWRTDQSVEVENYSDRFWLLSEGNVNGNDSLLQDDVYDTSKFTDIFTDKNSRIRKFMNEDGTEGSVCNWWLRSAYLGDSSGVGYVGYDGGVSGGSANSSIAVLPACLIG